MLAVAAEQAATSSEPVRAREGVWHALACRLGRNGAEVISVARRHEAFSETECEILGHLAVHAGVSIENAALHERVAEQATVDELTGLDNHRALQAFMAETLGRRAFRRSSRAGRGT